MHSFDNSYRQDFPQAKTPIERVVTGLVVIAVGIALLADNFGVRLPFLAWQNGWAVFILIGAVAPACKAWVRYRAAGGFDAHVAHGLLSAFTIAGVAVIFLLGLSLELWWPLFVIIGGLHAMLPRRDRRPREGQW